MFLSQKRVGSEMNMNHHKVRPYPILVCPAGNLWRSSWSPEHLLRLFHIRFPESNHVAFSDTSLPFLLAQFGSLLSTDFWVRSILTLSHKVHGYKGTVKSIGSLPFPLKLFVLASQYDWWVPIVVRKRRNILPDRFWGCWLILINRK